MRSQIRMILQRRKWKSINHFYSMYMLKLNDMFVICIHRIERNFSLRSVFWSCRRTWTWCLMVESTWATRRRIRNEAARSWTRPTRKSVMLIVASKLRARVRIVLHTPWELSFCARVLCASIEQQFVLLKLKYDDNFELRQSNFRLQKSCKFSCRFALRKLPIEASLTLGCVDGLTSLT